MTILLVLILLSNSIFVTSPRVYADPPPTAPPPQELILPNNLTDWILDEQAGYIYAISREANELYFIRLSDFSIEKRLTVGSMPTYMVKDGQRLQIALAGATAIKTVDLATKEVSDTVYTAKIAHSVAVSSDYIYYGTSEGEIYKLNKANRTSSKLSQGSFFYELALAVDEVTQKLYAGNISSYGGVFEIDTNTGDVRSQDLDYNAEMGGTASALKHIFIDQHFIYFGGHQFNKDNLIETTGTYTRTNDDYTYLQSVILQVTDSYVLTTQGVYDKATYLPLAIFPIETGFALMDSSGRAYIANHEIYQYGNKILRYSLALPAEPVTGQFTTISNAFKSDQVITDWTTTDDSPYIFSIVGDTNELVVIRKDDMNVVKKLHIGSNPREIEMLNNKLYIIFSGENHIAVMDTANILQSDPPVSRVTTKHYPVHVYPDDNRILYNGGAFSGGMSVTSAVYTTVADAVYGEHSTEINNPNTYVLDRNKDVLYGGMSGWLYKYNSDTFNLLETSYRDAEYYYSLMLDGNDLYYGNLRIDAVQPTTLYGTYPDLVVYARGGLVFSATAVYDKESFTKLQNLNMIINNAYVIPDSTIFVSTEKAIYKFGNIDEMQTLTSENRKPTDVTFIDTDLTSGRISGPLGFRPPVYNDDIQGYSIHLLDANGNKLQQLGFTRNNEQSTEQISVYDIMTSNLPEGAVSIGVFPIISTRYGSNVVLDVCGVTPFYDAPGYLPVNLAIVDTKPQMDKFAGTATWEAGSKEISNVRYYVYFITADGPVGDVLAVVKSGQRTYSVTIPEKDVPEQALGIGVFMKSDSFISPFFTGRVLEDKRSASVPASSITVNKFLVQWDSIVINNLSAGDIIRVYFGDKEYLMGGGTVASGQSSITIQIKNIGNPGDRLGITRQAVNRLESAVTMVTVPAIMNDNGAGGTGGGTGGGGGGGFIIPITPINEAGKLETKINVNKDGTRTSSTVVTADFIKEVTDEAEFSKNPVVLVQATEAEATRSSEFVVDPSLPAVITGKSKDAVLVFGSTHGKVQIPVDALNTMISSNKASEQKIIVTIGEAASDYKTKLNAQFTGTTSKPLGNPVEFEVKLTGGGQDRVLSEFNEFISHEWSLDVAKDDSVGYAGLTYDSTTQLFVPVPTVWDWKDGKLQVKLLRKGNSIYTVVRNNLSFSDVDSNNPYSGVIQTLANQMIISGYPDGSFMPEKTVTRAEFAALLNRALGILPQTQTSKSFDDVEAGAWYAPYVYAAANAHLINGYPDNSFRPDQQITHQEMIVMLVNALEYSGVTVDKDAASPSKLTNPSDLEDWAISYYNNAMMKGLLPSGGPFQFQTAKETQRQESALLLYQLLKTLNLTNTK